MKVCFGDIEVSRNHKKTRKMNDFSSLLKQKKTENTNVEITTLTKIEINKRGFSGGFCEPIFENNKLIKVKIVIDADEPDEVKKIKILFHELGHAKDYFNRKKELELTTLNNSNFKTESEFFAFENSLIEGLELLSKGRTDVLLSLLSIIPTRINEPIYGSAVEKIMKTQLWKRCYETMNQYK